MTISQRLAAAVMAAFMLLCIPAVSMASSIFGDADQPQQDAAQNTGENAAPASGATGIFSSDRSNGSSDPATGGEDVQTAEGQSASSSGIFGSGGSSGASAPDFVTGGAQSTGGQSASGSGIFGSGIFSGSTYQSGTTPSISYGDGSKLIAITFDDGPSDAYTPALLDALAKYGAHATFFMVGGKVKRNAALVQRMVNEGHQVGNHSYNHPKLTSLSNKEMAKQLTRTNNLIYNACGVMPTVCRPPYGSKSARVVKVMGENSLACVTWSIDPKDWSTRNAQKVCKYVVDNAYPGAIILLHDRRETGVKAAELILEALTAQGYTFVTVSELYGGGLQPGRTYSGSNAG